MKSRCYCENVSCLPFVAFWCQVENFGRTAFDDRWPVADWGHNARRCTLGCDWTAAEKWSAATIASVQVQQSWHPDSTYSSTCALRSSMRAPASAAVVLVLNRPHVAQARNLSSMHAPMLGLRGCLNFGQGSSTCIQHGSCKCPTITGSSAKTTTPLFFV